MNPRMQIPTLKIANIKATIEQFEAKDGDGSASLISK